MFRLNEAPSEVIAAINSAEIARNCGIFWSILCCPVTFGGTLWLDDNKNTDWGSCCCPRPVEMNSDVTLSLLMQILKGIKIKPENLKGKLSSEIRKVIDWQVKETIKVVEKAINDNVIQGNYRTALKQVLTSIQTKANTEEEFRKILETESSPLVAQQPTLLCGINK